MGSADPVLLRVITRAVRAAHACGRDMSGQSQAAVAAVLMVRPDMTALEAFSAVSRLGVTSSNGATSGGLAFTPLHGSW